MDYFRRFVLLLGAGIVLTVIFVACGGTSMLSDFYGQNVIDLEVSEHQEVCTLLADKFDGMDQQVQCNFTPSNVIIALKSAFKDNTTEYTVKLPDYDSCIVQRPDCDVEALDKCWEQMAIDPCLFFTHENCMAMGSCMYGSDKVVPENSEEYDGIVKVDGGHAVTWKISNEAGVGNDQIKICGSRTLSYGFQQMLLYFLDGSGVEMIRLDSSSSGAGCMLMSVASGSTHKFTGQILNAYSQNSWYSSVMLFDIDNIKAGETVNYTYYNQYAE